ncbi:hydroxyphenylacetyl-CoA thioesterase PaaI [Xylanimonas allomyrinae]|uniref:Hydroxyphenylacetyl-CoA thioesterase PaaI n=2 Tax=Xylanimonas allomyrinae TaxID=2509459 RepID=A0A4P6EQ70_9MICO|nr:hydroxyphenylacetyl-CoA thioesterase PaaI [Xylanimonas allomyrinae]
MMREDNVRDLLGITLVEERAGRAVMTLTVTDALTNGFGITHGGVVFTLADTAFAVACNEDERITISSGADIAFLAPTTSGDVLTATAVRRARRGRTGLYDVTVTADDGTVVAEMRGRSHTTSRTLTH